MIGVGNGRGESSFGASSSKFWVDLLNSTQLISKNVSHFPQIKACRLRMAYSKLENNKPIDNEFSLENSKGSFLLDKQSKNTLIGKSERTETKGLAIFNHNNTRYTKERNISFDATGLIRTIDVAEIKKLKKTKRNDSLDLNKNGLNKKSQQFTEYFKKVILSQRASNGLSKFFSEGKGLDIADRCHFQKLQRMNLSLLNRKIEDKEKSFLCVSKKINHYDTLRKQPQLPTLPKKPQKRDKAIKHEQKRNSKQLNSFLVCEPWESDQIQHDFQLH